MTTNLLGKIVTFSLSQQEILKGQVVDKIDMYQKPADEQTITGYIISVGGKLYNNIAHWRLLSIVEDGAEKTIN